MSQKNKRNTRRGRAKRWWSVRFAEGTVHHSLRRSRVSISVSPRGRVDVHWPGHAKKMPSKTAAMRAAEHLARAAKTKRGGK